MPPKRRPQGSFARQLSLGEGGGHREPNRQLRGPGRSCTKTIPRVTPRAQGPAGSNVTRATGGSRPSCRGKHAEPVWRQARRHHRGRRPPAKRPCGPCHRKLQPAFARFGSGTKPRWYHRLGSGVSASGHDW